VFFFSSFSPTEVTV